MKTALIGGAMGYGAQAAGFQRAAPGKFLPQMPTATAQTRVVADPYAVAGKAGQSTGLEKQGIMGALGNFAKENPLTTAGLGLGTLALLGQTEEEEAGEQRPFPKGEMFDITARSRESGDVYQLTEPEDLEAYRREISDFNYYHGGEVNGPGTGTSDSVPARLSDGEFVMTAAAVRGAGGGDRDIGAARMYDMMAELEAQA